VTALKPPFLLHSKWFSEASLASGILNLTDAIPMHLWQVRDTQLGCPN
jgi:hypothetical protein